MDKLIDEHNQIGVVIGKGLFIDIKMSKKVIE
jgi:hypothetical protein